MLVSSEKSKTKPKTIIFPIGFENDANSYMEMWVDAHPYMEMWVDAHPYMGNSKKLIIL